MGTKCCIKKSKKVLSLSLYISTIYQSIINFVSMDNLKYLKSISSLFHNTHRDAIALLISASDFPAATAFSIRESEIAELEPKFIKSSVNGIPNF